MKMEKYMREKEHWQFTSDDVNRPHRKGVKPTKGKRKGCEVCNGSKKSSSKGSSNSAKKKSPKT